MSASRSDRPSSEAALLLDTVFRTVINGFIIIDSRGIIEMVNGAAARLFGYRESEMVGHNVSMLMPAPHQERHDSYIRHYLDTGERRIIGIGREVEGRRKDGTLFPMRLSISEMEFNGEKKFTGMVQDLTEEKKASQALRQEKEKAEMYFDLANTLNTVVDATGQLVELNRKAETFIGRPKSEWAGQPWAELLLSAQAPPLPFDFAKMARGEQAFVPVFETETTDCQGKKFFFTWYNNQLQDESGTVTGFILSGTDITRRKMIELELEKRVEQRTEELANAVNELLKSNKKLQYEIQERKAAVEALHRNEKELRKAMQKEVELSQLKSRFVSMASHEFRTPLATIQSSVDLIEAYEQAEQQPQRLKHTRRVRSAVTNLTNILNDFLSLSRLEEGNITPHPVPVSLPDFCGEVLEELNGILKEGQQIEASLPPGEEPLMLDKKIFKNILLNLLSNAIKYSPAGSPIRCSITLADRELTLVVEDEGIGIPEEDQPHLFSRFFRAHNVENIKGTGLGLHIVKQYARLLGGDIGFRSQEGAGTTFTLRIPVSGPPAAG